MKQRGKTFTVLVILLFLLSLINFVFANPNIYINSPQNITYTSTKIPLNVTADEPVDFFFKDLKTGRVSILERDSVSLQSYLYAKNGSYNFIIWANNSNGVTNQSVIFSDTMHNPINITDCGYLLSSDAEYVLVNNISTSAWTCFNLESRRGISVNLNGYWVNGDSSNYNAFSIYSSDMQIFNGTIYGIATPGRYDGPHMIELAGGTKMKLYDLYIHGYAGIYINTFDGLILENVRINSTIPFWFYSLSNAYLINCTFIWNGRYYEYNQFEPEGIFDESDHATLYLENISFQNFPNYDIVTHYSYSDFFLRNTNLNFSRIDYAAPWPADTRFFSQHLVIINISDQFNQTGSGVIEVTDNGLFERREGFDALMTTDSNPTAHVLVSTNSRGIGQAWLTEKLILARTSSPMKIYEYAFYPYNLTARSWNSTESRQLNLSSNSTINVDFKLNIPQELPECTILDMLDLNNDGIINTQDAVIILRQITGLSVSANQKKNCEGISLNPF